jgi:signal transduction histidine kinase
VIGLDADRQVALGAVERVSIAGRNGSTAAAVLDGACGTVADAFDFDSVTAWQYDMEAEDVFIVAVAGEASADRAGPHSIADFSLLAEARKDRDLVRGADGDVTSLFALPLLSGDRCLGFLTGARSPTGPRSEPDWGGLGTVGIVASTLLENALAREELQHRDILKSEFIALAVHELRNPLSSIYGISATMKEHRDELTEEQNRALLSALVEQTARMRQLAEQLLDLSRLDLDAIRISPTLLQLRPKIEELVRTLADALPGGAVTIAVPPALEVVVDAAALDRMLSNLISNSLRHGSPPVTVTAARRDSHLRLVVEDRGDGVPREFVPRLFQRFARGSESSATEGSGLGLTIAQAYARAHGGKIDYEEAEPHGARFEVVIPLRQHNELT